MEDTPMMAQGIRYNWRDRLISLRDAAPMTQVAKVEYQNEWPTPGALGVCPVCHPVSKERLEAMGEDGVMAPRLCGSRFTYKVRQHARANREDGL